jgi:flagellin
MARIINTNMPPRHAPAAVSLTQTALAGVKPPDGTSLNARAQIGTNAGETLSISILANVAAGAMGTCTAAAATTGTETASQSRIQDADFAEETARQTRAQILQQADAAMLAQANAVPQSVLALLEG